MNGPGHVKASDLMQLLCCCSLRGSAKPWPGLFSLATSWSWSWNSVSLCVESINGY